MTTKKKSGQRKAAKPASISKKLTPWEKKWAKEEAERKAVAAQKRKELKAKKTLIAQLEQQHGVTFAELRLPFGSMTGMPINDITYEFECKAKAKKGQLLENPLQLKNPNWENWGDYGWFQYVGVGYCSTNGGKEYCQKYDLDRAVDRLSELGIIDCVAILFLLEKDPDKLKAICDANLEGAKLQFHQLLNDFVWKP